MNSNKKLILNYNSNKIISWNVIMRKLIFLKKSSKQVVNTNFLKNNFSFINDFKFTF